MAAHGCIPCSRYFATPVALQTHLTGKPHKRRLKTMLEDPYTIEESRRAAGLVEVPYSVGKASAAAVKAKEMEVEVEVGAGA